MARPRTVETISPELHDKRQPGWFWMDDAIIEKHGRNIGPYGIAVYALLAKYANKEGQSFPSHKTMIELLGLSRQSILRTIERLIAEKLISKEKRLSSHGDYASNIYTLLPLQRGSTLQVLPSTPQALPSTHEDLRWYPTGTTVVPDVDTNQTILTREEKKKDPPPTTKKKARSPIEPKKKVTPGPRSHFLPEEFVVTEPLRSWAQEHFPDVDVEAATEEMRDHEYAKPHSDWSKAWRNWIRRTPDYSSNGQRVGRKHKNEHEGHRIANYPSGKYCHDCKRDVSPRELIP